MHYGFIPCTLGPRILRAETAPLVALAAIQAVLGDFA
jgi:RsmE family RNA methyltransferase